MSDVNKTSIQFNFNQIRSDSQNFSQFHSDSFNFIQIDKHAFAITCDFHFFFNVGGFGDFGNDGHPKMCKLFYRGDKANWAD